MTSKGNKLLYPKKTVFFSSKNHIYIYIYIYIYIRNYTASYARSQGNLQFLPQKPKPKKNFFELRYSALQSGFYHARDVFTYQIIQRHSVVDRRINHTYPLVFRRISLPPVSRLTAGLKCEVKSLFSTLTFHKMWTVILATLPCNYYHTSFYTNPFHR